MAANFASTSAKLTRTPRIFINSPVRPLIQRYPSSSRQPKSPVLSQPPLNLRCVASASSRYPEQTDVPHLDLAGLPRRNFSPHLIDDPAHQIVQEQTGTANVLAQAIWRKTGNA